MRATLLRSAARALALGAAGYAATGTALGASAVTVESPARDTIVETVLVSREVKAQVARLRETSTADAATRVVAARRLVQAGRASGDPRLLGYAEAQLGTADDAESLVLRATIAQSQHRFDVARALLDDALRRVPEHVQARLTRASIAQAQGRHREALHDCAGLADHAPAAAQVCTALSEAATGAPERALQRLGRSASEPGVRGWALSVAGEIQLQLGQPALAARSLRSALAVEEDLYTRVALADALLAVGQPAEAQRVLVAAPAVDAVLLRRWQAERRLPSSGAPSERAPADELARQLDARFALDATRGTPLHAREAGRFALDRGRTAEALQLARRNWSSQREAADALLLAEAARAAGDATTLRELQRWLDDAGLRDRRIDVVLAGSAR